MKALSLDIGASSGRLIAIDFNGKDFIVDETYRFLNGMQKDSLGNIVWNLDSILCEVKKGIEISKEKYPEITTLGIDTWACDYARLEADDSLPKTIDAYRSCRCKLAQEMLLKDCTYDEIYKESGIQNLPFNTIFQLYDDHLEGLDISKVLLVPDAISYYLTGVKQTELTNFSTTGLYDPISRKISDSNMALTGYQANIFAPIVEPCKLVGVVKPELLSSLHKVPLEIITVASHDTASAVASCLLDSKSAYLSLGTWALLGVENDTPIIDEESKKLNFTNEIGVNHSVRFLKNITGLFIIQELVKEINASCEQKITYQYLEEQVQKVKEDIDFYIDVDDKVFQEPGHMIASMREYAERTKQTFPDKISKLAKAIYLSMAMSYNRELKNLEKLIGRKIERLVVIGGGTKSKVLLQTIADVLNIHIETGQEEATALGNAIVQLVYQGVFESIDEARQKLASVTKSNHYYQIKPIDEKVYQKYKERTGREV